MGFHQHSFVLKGFARSWLVAWEEAVSLHLLEVGKGWVPLLWRGLEEP